MKTTLRSHPLHRRALAGSAALLIAGVFPLHAQTAGSYSFIDLGVPVNFESSYGYGLNNRGQVVGAVTNFNSFYGTDLVTPYVYTPGIGFQTIPVAAGFSGTAAYEISDAGVVVGTSGNGRAFRFSGGTATEFMPLTGAGQGSAFGVNESAASTGTATSSAGPVHAFIDPAAVDIGVLPGSAANATSTGYGINESGAVAGANNNAGIENAFLYTGAGGMVSLHSLVAALQSGVTSSRAYDVNDSGLVVGNFSLTSGFARAFTYSAAGGAAILATTNSFSTTAASVNSRGQIVGTTAATYNGFFYDPAAGYLPLISLVQGHTGGLTVSKIGIDVRGHAINDWGQIVGNYFTGGFNHTVLLSPLTPLTASTNGGANFNVKFTGGMTFDTVNLPTDPLPGSFHTQPKLLSGTAGANRDVTSAFSIGTGAGFASDVVSLSGTGTDVFTLQLSYDEAAAISLFGTENLARLDWLDPADSTWKDATLGNTGAGALAGFYAQSYTDFLATHGGTFNSATMLGAEGLDTTGNTVWAVLNHNSGFAVATPTPEPGTGLLTALGALACAGFRPRRKADAPAAS